MLNVAGVAPRVAPQAMRHSDIKLTMKHYTDTELLDVSSALEHLPRIGTNSKVAPAADKTRQDLAKIGKVDEFEKPTADMQKPLENIGSPRVFDSRGDRIRTYDPLLPKQMR